MWKTPKTDWTIDDRFNIEDYNRIKNNLNYLHEKSEEIYGEYTIADMGEDVLSHAGFWDVATFNEFESNLETINAHMINAEIGLKQTFYPNGVFIGFAELNRIEGATLTLKAVIDGWYEGMKVLSFRLGGSQIGSDRIQRKDSVVSIAVTGTESIHAYVDEPLDLTGVVVTATYKSGETQNVTSECVFDPANGTIMTQTGQQTISVSYTEDGKTVTTSFTVNVDIFVPTFAEGTPKQLATALRAHYNGDIDIHNYWKVGDTRTITLPAISAYTYTSSDVEYTINGFSEQQIKLRIIHSGGKTLKKEQQECAFLVDMDSCFNGLRSTCPDGKATDFVKWGIQKMLPAINEVMGDIFKTFNTKMPYPNSTYGVNEVAFIFYTEYELTGQNHTCESETAISGLNPVHFDYYKELSKTLGNPYLKKLGINGGYVDAGYWLANRTKSSTTSEASEYCYMGRSGYPTSTSVSVSTAEKGICLYGAI